MGSAIAHCYHAGTMFLALSRHRRVLQTDPASYLGNGARWQPTLPPKSAAFRMTDFLTFAGVDPQSRGQ
jgi:hypothetical protein